MAALITYLMITLLTEGPQLSEYLSQARVLANPVPGGASAERMDRMRGLAALTTFATWRPGRILLGAYLFGGVTMLQFHLQAQGVQIPSQVLSMLPYLATIVVLALISRNPTWIRVNMPASLGKPYYPGS